MQFSQPDRRKDAENTVQMVIDYIRLNYNNDITLKDLAENVFFLKWKLPEPSSQN